jgi:hypothetical protein
MDGLYSLRRPQDVAKLRGISVREVLGVGTEPNGEGSDKATMPASESGAAAGGE